MTSFFSCTASSGNFIICCVPFNFFLCHASYLEADPISFKFLAGCDHSHYRSILYSFCHRCVLMWWEQWKKPNLFMTKLREHSLLRLTTTSPHLHHWYSVYQIKHDFTYFRDPLRFQIISFFVFCWTVWKIKIFPGNRKFYGYLIQICVHSDLYLNVPNIINYM